MSTVKVTRFEGVDLERLKASLKEEADEETRQTLAQPDRPSGYAVDCPVHGRVPLGLHNYVRQLAQPNRFWSCLRCGATADIVEPDSCQACDGEGSVDTSGNACQACNGLGFIPVQP